MQMFRTDCAILCLCHPAIPFQVQTRAQNGFDATTKTDFWHCEAASMQMCNYNILPTTLKWSHHGLVD